MVAQSLTTAHWLPSWQHRHAQAMTVVTLGLAALCLVLNDLPLTMQALALAVGVSVLGIPHGGLDHVVAQKTLAPKWGRSWIPIFLTGYLGLAALVWVGWRLAPAWVMGLFLLASIIHFGLGDVEPELTLPRGYGLEVLARGAIPIVVVAWRSPQEVATLFHWVAPAMSPATWLALVQTAIIPILIVLLPTLTGVIAYHAMMAIRQRDRRHATHAVEIAALTGLCAVAPPLVSFLVYFCGWHAARHTLWLASQFEPNSGGQGLARVAVRALPLTIVTLLGSAVAWWQLDALYGGLEATIQVVFVTLSMLTFPHMVITALAASNVMAPPPRRLHKLGASLAANARQLGRTST